MTNDPVLHALVDLVQALTDHPATISQPLHDAYGNAMKVIRERVGFDAAKDQG